MQKKVLVFGGTGMVGSHIEKALSPLFTIISPKHNDVDILNYKQIKEILDDVRPDIIIHSAGLASIEKCEENPKLATKINAKSAEFIISAIQNRKIPLYYISTDAVFEGTNGFIPFSETLKPTPRSAYSLSKTKGEEIVMQDKTNCIIRITLPYADKFEDKSDLIRNLISVLKNGKNYSGIIDQYINPLSLLDVGEGIKTLIKNQASGIYHVAANESVSNYDFLFQAAKLFKLPEKKIKKIKLSKFLEDKKAFRANFCVLGVGRFNNDFYILPTVKKSLENYRSRFAF